jgi:hypothetical protein
MILSTKRVKIALSAALAALFFSMPLLAQDTGSIKGKVRTQKGDGIAAVTVTVRQEGKDLRSVKTDKDGKFQMSGLRTGIYNVVFEKSGYSGGVLYDVEVRRKKTNNLGDRAVLTVDQGTLVILEASVFNQNGFVLPGARVIVEEVGEKGKLTEVADGYSSGDGDVIFRFREKSTTYRITASLRGRSAFKDVVVTSAAIYRTAISIDLSKEN